MGRLGFKEAHWSTQPGGRQMGRPDIGGGLWVNLSVRKQIFGISLGRGKWVDSRVRKQMGRLDLEGGGKWVATWV